MNLNWFKTFTTVAVTRSFSATARILNLTQPAVSKHIAGLEAFYGVKLVDRSRRTVTLTEAGATLLPHAERILEAMAEAARELETFLETVRGTLVIGASTIPGHYVLPPLIRRFREQHPEVNIILEVADSGRILRRVLEGDLLLGAVGAFSPVTGIEAIPFAEDEIVLILPLTHPLTRYRKIPVSLLSEYEFVWRERESGTRQVVERALAQAGLNPASLHLAAELGSTEAVLAAVEAGMGPAFVSLRAAEKRSREGLILTRRLEGLPIKRVLYLIHRQNPTLPATVRAFINFIRQVK
uniref:LysR family transcriptional regulator n=1 Tax=Ammonifex degensii TaxID=42838 RepID=A0A7C1JLR2_9THEO